MQQIITSQDFLTEDEIQKFRDETSGTRKVIHLNNAGAGLMPDIVTKAQIDHLKLELFLQANAALHVKFADEFSKKVKAMIDDFIEKNKLEAPAPQLDEADIPDVEASCTSAITSLNMKEKKVSSVIWSTGFNADFSYIKLAVFNSEGSLLHRNGIFDINGLYLLGFPWQRYRKSAILFGMRDDAEFIADKVYNYSKTKPLAESV